jgi:hypothetical protein
MSKLTLKKPYKKRGKVTHNKNTQKGRGFFSVKPSVYGSASRYFSPLSAIKSTANRLQGKTTFVDGAGKLQAATRNMRGLKPLISNPFRKRTFDEAVKYKTYSFNRLKGMQGRLDLKDASIAGKIGKMEFKQRMKLSALQDKINLNLAKNPHSNKLTVLKNKLQNKTQKYSNVLEKYQIKKMNSLKPYKDKLTSRINKFKEMERTVGATLRKKINSTNLAVLSSTIKKCKRDSNIAFNRSDCVSKALDIFKNHPPGSQTPISIEYINTKMSQGPSPVALNLTKTDVYNANKGLIFRAAARRKAKRASNSGALDALRRVDAEQGKVLEKSNKLLYSNQASRFYTTQKAPLGSVVTPSSVATPSQVLTPASVPDQLRSMGESVA